MRGHGNHDQVMSEVVIVTTSHDAEHSVNMTTPAAVSLQTQK